MKALELSIIVGLSILFTVALLFVTLETAQVINDLFLNVFPDWGLLWDFEKMRETVEFLRPIGYFAFATVVVLIFVGFMFERGYLSTFGSLALYLPVFGYFAFTMFFLAGVGVFRALWFPLMDISPRFLSLGNIIYIPYFVLAFPFVLLGVNARELIPLLFMILGILSFLMSTMTWLYGKFEGLKIVDFGIYKHSRHPQYFGYVLWSYGLLLLATFAGAPKGGYVPPPSLPWLISALTIIGVALNEETMMVKKHGEKYTKYRENTPFMLHLPKHLSALITAPARALLKKSLPENRKEVVFIIIIYGTTLVLLSLPSILFFPR